MILLVPGADVLVLVYDVLEWVVPLGMVPVLALHHRSHVALAWLVLVWALPVLGTLAWLYLGLYRPRRARERREALDEVARRARDLDDPERSERAAARLSPELADLAGLVRRLGMRRLGGWPVVDGNRAEVIDEPGAFAERLVRDIGEAGHSVDLLFYLVADDATGRRVADALVAAQRRGVRCRVLAGAWASHWESSRSFFRELAPRLQEAGVDVRSLRPLTPLRRGLARVDLRNHRKIAVLDAGRVGYVGSENLHDPDMGLEEGGIWHQVSVRLEGPAARHLALVFLHDWMLDGGRTRPDEPLAPPGASGDGVAAQIVWWGPSDDAPAVKVLIAALGAARERVVLVTPYFVPDRPVLLALVAAALRGVRVDLVVPARSDRAVADAAGRAVFGELLDAGVRIHRHQEGLLHAKCLTLDGRVAMVGSANGDRRSFYLDDEVVALLYDEEVARRVLRRQEAWLRASEPVDAERFAARGRWARTRDHVAALASPLL